MRASYTLRVLMEKWSQNTSRPANEPSELGARLGLLGVNRDRAPIFRSRPNRAESEKTYDFRDRAETSNHLSKPRPSSGNSFSACLGSARKSRKSVCITQSARSIVIGNHICVLQHAFKRSENSRQVVSPGAMAGTVTVTVTVTVVTVSVTVTVIRSMNHRHCNAQMSDFKSY